METKLFGLANELYEFFCECYNVKYIRRVTIKNRGDFYSLVLDQNNREKPVTLMGTFDDLEMFRTYIFKELRSKRLDFIEYHYLIQVINADDPAPRQLFENTERIIDFEFVQDEDNNSFNYTFNFNLA